MALVGLLLGPEPMTAGIIDQGSATAGGRVVVGAAVLALMLAVPLMPQRRG